MTTSDGSAVVKPSHQAAAGTRNSEANNPNPTSVATSAGQPGYGSTGGVQRSGGTASGQASTNSPAAAVAQDQAAVTLAQQAADATTLTSPISGTVGAINGMAAGQMTTGTSSITVVAGGTATVTVNAPLALMPKLQVGQSADVAVPGGTAASGSISQIALLPTSTASTPTYAVTIVVPDAPSALASGSSTQVAIDLQNADNTVVVPASALTMVGTNQATVQVIKGNAPTSEGVTVGAVGGGQAAVTGISAGQQVVLANLKQPLTAAG